MSRPSEQVLVIDDEPLITQMLHRMLRRRFVVVAETDGASALARLEGGEPFGLVICDLMMKPLSGADVWNGVRRVAPPMLGRFVLMTGGACLRDVEQFLETWPHPVLFKPFAAVDVERIIEDTLARLPQPPAARVG